MNAAVDRDFGEGAMTVVCLCHLAMEKTLFQRPQQIMQRLARAGNTVVYAGCVGRARAAQLEASGTGAGSLEGNRLRYLNLPYSPLSRRFVAIRRALAARWIRAEIRKAISPTAAPTPLVAWIYHPGLLPLARKLNPVCIVYDVMDRFPCFEVSGEQTSREEMELLAAADVVFAGGRSLAASCREVFSSVGFGKHVHCYPSGVDLAHFGKAMAPGTAIPADVAGVPRPVLGYFGAVDERIDFDLLGQLCDAHPEWSVVLVGPIVGKPEIPPLANLHLFGARHYEELPAYLKAFDICLLPFRATELVAHVSPTKTPEYLAGGKPVVSTRIPDVVADYGDMVAVAESPEEFDSACAAALEAGGDPAGFAAVAESRAMTWEQIAAEMEETVRATLKKCSSRGPGGP
jgi:UDP-galactopyranose mutase